MAPMKRAAPGAAGVNSRCNSVKKAIEGSTDCPARVKQMLCKTLSYTAGTPTADRDAFSARFVAMIAEVLNAENVRLTQDVAAKEAALAELTPAKSSREATLEEKQGVAKEKTEAYEAAKKAVSEVAATVKEAAAKVKEALKAQKDGDVEAQGIAAKKAALEAIVSASLTPLVDGTAEDKPAQVAAVMGAGKDFGFDTSLMNTAAQVLEREAAERGAFDATCLEQLKEAFASGIVKLGEEYAAHGPAMAERAGAVQQAEDAKQAADASQADLKEKLAAAKEAKAAADGEQKAASKSLADFIPELKATGDALDAAKKAVKAFEDGAKTAFTELTDFKEGDFIRKSYHQQVDGMKLDRSVIDACRAGVGPESASPGRISVEDAQKVFEKIADGGRETRTERWTLRYCLEEFLWSEPAHDWIVEELKRVPQEDEPKAKKARTAGKGYYETIDGCKCDRSIVDVCREALAAEGATGRLSLDDANKVWSKAADGNKVTLTEKWTLRYCLSAFNFTRDAHDFVHTQLHALDAKGKVVPPPQ